MATELSPDVRRQLDEIELSDIYGVPLYLCSAQLSDGRVLNCVYFVDGVSFKRLCGWERPEAVPGGKPSIAADQVSQFGTARFGYRPDTQMRYIN
jgi:hypothetical protein